MRPLGFGLVFFAAIAWSLGGLGIKLVEASSLAIAGYRSLFALPIVWFAYQFSGKGHEKPAGVAARKSVFRNRFVWFAALAYTLTLILFVAATKLTTAANAILLQYTAPIYVTLLSWPILRERVYPRDVFAVLGCLFGVGWFFRGDLSSQGMLGNVFALLSGIGFGLLPLLLRKIGQDNQADRQLAERAPFAAIIVGNALVVAVCTPSMVIQGSVGVRGLVVLLGLGIVQIGLAYVAFGAGMKRIRAVEGVMVAMIEPILNPTWVAIVIGERPSSSALVGGTCIVLAVALHSLWSTLRPQPLDHHAKREASTNG